MQDHSDAWISAAAARKLLESAMSPTRAAMTIAARANDGLLQAKASRFVQDKEVGDDVKLPSAFWWARGDAALKQNWITGDFETWIRDTYYWRAYNVQFLQSEINQIVPEKTLGTVGNNMASRPIAAGGRNIFIGHGRSQIWRELKDFIVDALNLKHDEFNARSVAGVAVSARLQEMLNNAAFAFLVLTAEDERVDGKIQARMNVIHEVGLFQGKLGFEKAIILLEEGCETFSNISGLNYISFPKGSIGASFEEIRRVLKRERILNES